MLIHLFTTQRSKSFSPGPKVGRKGPKNGSRLSDSNLPKEIIFDEVNSGAISRFKNSLKSIRK